MNTHSNITYYTSKLLWIMLVILTFIGSLFADGNEDDSKKEKTKGEDSFMEWLFKDVEKTTKKEKSTITFDDFKDSNENGIDDKFESKKENNFDFKKMIENVSTTNEKSSRIKSSLPQSKKPSSTKEKNSSTKKSTTKKTKTKR